MMKYLIYLGLLAALFAITQQAQQLQSKDDNKLNVKFSESKVIIHMDTKMNLTLKITGLDTISPQNGLLQFRLKSNKPHLVQVENKIIKPLIKSTMWIENFTIYGNFLGNGTIYLELLKENNETERLPENLTVIIIRKMRIIDHVFTGSVILLVSLLYINFGAALDFAVLKGIFMRPIGPIIGFIGQFLIMPTISYLLGYILFPDMPELHLGLFFTGVSPGGGASNIWTVILGGNINLSILMTTISTFAAFGMMPLWLFTLGKTIFDRGNMVVPYDRITSFALGLIIPLFIGIAIQRYLPRVSRILVRLLKPISITLILFIVIFAIVTNLYLFELFSWKIALAGLGLPWLGYILSWTAAKLFKQSGPDAMAIAVETGVQNTGIAIFLLRLSLEQPQGDLTTVMPVSVAIMTPLPLFLLYICQKIWRRYHPSSIQRTDSQSIIKSDIS